MKIDAPLKVASTYRQRAGHWRLPVLSGLISAPTLRPDGTVLAKSGYDVSTGLLLDFQGARFPVLPAQPTREMAEAALRVLEDLISTFPVRRRTLWDRAGFLANGGSGSSSW